MAKFRLEGTVTHSLSNPEEVGNKVVYTIYGDCVEVIVEDEQGRMWAVCEDEPQANQINFNPYTGVPALKKIGE